MKKFQVRRVDELGRVVLPFEGRKMLGINDFDSVEISYTEKAIIIKKHKEDSNHCIVCGRDKNLTVLHSIHICKSCLFKEGKRHNRRK